MKSLVTGGAGFIGSHIVDALIEKGHQVVIIDDLSTGNKEFINPRAKFIEKSITEDLSQIFQKEKFDYVFHLAAQIDLRKSLLDPVKDAEINILGSLNVINQCIKNKVKKFIFSSSAAVYSPEAKIPASEDDKISPLSSYGLAKYTVENYLKILKNIHGLDYVTLRYSNVYGPRQSMKGEAGVVSIFIKNILADKQITIFGSGEQTRDFIFVKDVVEANLLAINLSGIYNVSTSIETSVNKLTENLKKLIKKDAKIIHSDAIKGELQRSALSYENLKKLGFQPKYHLEQGLKETIDFFKSSDSN